MRVRLPVKSFVMPSMGVLAARWQIAPNAVTVAEVEARMGSTSEVRNLLAVAEEAIYSKCRFVANDLEKWRRVMLRQLQGGVSP